MISALQPLPFHVMQQAKTIYEQQKKEGPFNHSLTDGEATLHGIIGELLTINFLQSCGVDAIRKNTFEFDLTAGRIKIEVKTQRQEKQAVHSHYDVNVEDRLRRNLRQQDCDVYVFCRVDNAANHGAVIGWATHEDVYHSQRWTLKKKGEMLGSGSAAKADCWCLPFSRLAEPKQLAEYIFSRRQIISERC